VTLEKQCNSFSLLHIVVHFFRLEITIKLPVLSQYVQYARPYAVMRVAGDYLFSDRVTKFSLGLCTNHGGKQKWEVTPQRLLITMLYF